MFKAPANAERCGLGDSGAILIKRIVGRPGELISARDGTIYMGGERLTEP